MSQIAMPQDTASLSCTATTYAVLFYCTAASVIIRTAPATYNLLRRTRTISRDYLETPHTSEVWSSTAAKWGWAKIKILAVESTHIPTARLTASSRLDKKRHCTSIGCRAVQFPFVSAKQVRRQRQIYRYIPHTLMYYYQVGVWEFYMAPLNRTSILNLEVCTFVPQQPTWFQYCTSNHT